MKSSKSLSWGFSTLVHFSSVQFSSVAQLCLTLCDPMDCSPPGFPVHHQLQSLLKLMSIKSVMPSNHRILCRSLLPLLQSFPASGSFSMSQPFASSGQSTEVSPSASVLPSNEYSGLISFRIDCFDPLAVQGTHKSLLQHHSSKASILWCSAFFIVQLSHPYLTTGKTIALTGWTLVSKIISLLFNMLPRLVIAFLPRSKRLLVHLGIFSTFRSGSG